MLSKKKEQIIRFEQNLCNASVDNNEVLFVRVEDIVKDKRAQIIVPLTHTAMIVKGGGDCRFYKSGNYPVFDDKTEIKNWKRGMPVEVIYIPKETCVPVLWGTPSRLRYRDKTSNKVITIGANGKVEISVSNPEQFFRKVVGAKKEFNLKEFQTRFGLTIANHFGNVFLEVIDEKNLTYDQFDANREFIFGAVSQKLNAIFERDWGLSLTNLETKEIGISDEDMEAIEDAAAEKQKQDKVKEYLQELERLDDKNWEREKYLRQLELQDKNAYYEVLKVIGEKPSQCPGCGHPYKSTDKFCPHCGMRLSLEPVVCSHCGKQNESTALFCSNCGNKLEKGDK